MKNRTILLPLAAVFLSLSGCQDSEWDDHYDASSTAAGSNLLEVLRSQSEFTSFVSAVEQLGLDTLLSLDQTFTVFAPTNTAMAQYDATSDDTTRLVENTMARYIYGPSDLVDTASIRICMLNGKYNYYSREDGTYTIGGVALDGSVLAASNGVIYPIDSPIPFYYNLWESLEYGEQTDSIYNYIASFDLNELDTSASTAIGQNENGQTVYDSVFVYSNDWMEAYGFLYLEDSVYTAIVPTNEAWRTAYETIAPHFKTFGSLISDNSSSSSIIVSRTYDVSGVSGEDSLQNAHTCQAIVQDLVFRGRIDDPSACDGDSLTSTAGNVFHSPASLFEGATQTEASNGLYYLTDRLNYNPEDSWMPRIDVEAEDASGRTYNYATLTRRNITETAFADSVSEMYYLEVNPTSTNSLFQPQVSFDIPNVLAGKYDIYADFAPACAFDSLATADSTKVRFYVNYVHEDGTMKEDTQITTDPDGEPFITHGTTMTRFCVAKAFEFPYANYTDSPFAESREQTTNVKVRVVTNVTNTETAVMTRIMRIDRLIFVPVTEDNDL